MTNSTIRDTFDNFAFPNHNTATENAKTDYFYETTERKTFDRWIRFVISTFVSELAEIRNETPTEEEVLAAVKEDSAYLNNYKEEYKFLKEEQEEF